MATSKGTFVAFDWLRLVAIAFVALHHALIAGYHPSSWHRLDFGQLGVGIFCALSGFLLR